MTRFLALFLIGCFSLTACSKQPDETIKPAQEPVVAPAWLHQSLPDTTVAYARLPSPWFLFAGQDNGFALAQNNEAHNQQVELIRQALTKNVIQHLKPPADHFAKLLVEHMQSPLEIALVQQSQGQPMPIMVMATQFDFADRATFEQMLAQSIKDLTAKGLQHSADSDGSGTLSMQTSIARYRYDEENQQFLLVAGFATSVTVLNKVMEAVSDNPDHLMQAMQQQIDSSANGLFVWLNAQQVMPILTMSMPPQELQQLQQWGLDKMNALALGYGVSDRKTRLKVLVDMPKVGLRNLIPEVNNQFDVATVGTPRTMVLLSIPSSSQQKQMLNSFSQLSGNSDSSYEQLDQLVQENLGFTMEQFTSVIGPELIYFRDDIGGFAATKINDRALLQKMIDRLVAKGKAHYRTHSFQGVQIHELSIKALTQEDLAVMKDEDIPPPVKIMANASSHYYWLEEDGYLIYASVPQPLMERVKRGPDHSLSQWLKESQGQELANALFAATTSVRDLSRNSYHYYLEGLLLVSDLTGAQIDIMALPTADQMGFAEYGAIGVKLDSGEQYLGLELSFEQSASDLLLTGGGLQTVAVTGILAAVAIPAYQDYTKRTKSAEAMVTAMALKAQVARALLEGAPVEELDLGKHGIQQQYVSSVIADLEVEDGVITLHLDSATFADGFSPVTLVFKPNIQHEFILGWDCTGGTLDEKYRPAECRP